jgi:hypothetical protein
VNQKGVENGKWKINCEEKERKKSTNWVRIHGLFLFV